MLMQPPPFEGPRQPGAGMHPPNGNFGGPPSMGPGISPPPIGNFGGPPPIGSGPMPRPMNQGGNGFQGPADNGQTQLNQKFGNLNLNDGPGRLSDAVLKAYLGKSVAFRIRPHEEKARKAGESPKLSWARAEKSQLFYKASEFDTMIDQAEPKGSVMAQQDSLDTSAQRKAVDQAVVEWRDQETDRRFSWDLVCVIAKRLKNQTKSMMSRNQRDRQVREIRIVLQRVLAEPLLQSSMAGGKGKDGIQGTRDGFNGGLDNPGGRPVAPMFNSQAGMNQGNMNRGGPTPIPMPSMNQGPPLMPPNHGPPPMHPSNGPLPIGMNNANGFNRPPPPPPPQNFPPMPIAPMNGPPFQRPPMNQMPPPGRPMPRPDDPAGIEIVDDDDDEPPRMRGGRSLHSHDRRPPPIVTDNNRDHRRRSPNRSRSRSRSRRSRRNLRHRGDDAYSRSSVYSSEDEIFSPHSPRSFGSPMSSTHASLASSSRHRRRGGVVEYHRGKRGSPHSGVFVRRPSTSSKSYHGRGGTYGRASLSDFDHLSDDEELGYRRRHREHDLDRERDIVRRGSIGRSESERSRHRRRDERDRYYRDDRLGRDYDRYEEEKRRFGGHRGQRDSMRSEFLG